MPRSDHDRVVALAGLFLAISQVRGIARRGALDSEDFETSLLSLLTVEAPSSEAVYGELFRLRNGLQLVVRQLERRQDVELTRYAVALLVLERKLVSRPALLARLRQGIQEATAKLDYFPVTHQAVVASLAQTYLATVSTLGPRIMVHGEHLYLNRPENAERIRCLLLAGIRAAWLWRQSGGGRFTLLWRREPLLVQARRLLGQLAEPSS